MSTQKTKPSKYFLKKKVFICKKHDIFYDTRPEFRKPMKLEFNRIAKTRMVGIRLTQEEFSFVEKLAKDNNVSQAEACMVLIRAAIKEVKEHDK